MVIRDIENRTLLRLDIPQLCHIGTLFDALCARVQVETLECYPEEQWPVDCAYRGAYIRIFDQVSPAGGAH
jgi:hypothetical protein